MADNCKGKSWWEPGGIFCKGKDAAEDGVGDIISGQMKEFAQSITEHGYGNHEVVQYLVDERAWTRPGIGRSYPGNNGPQLVHRRIRNHRVIVRPGSTGHVSRLQNADIKWTTANCQSHHSDCLLCHRPDAGDRSRRRILKMDSHSGQQPGWKSVPISSGARRPWSQLGYWRLDPIWLARTHKVWA